MQPQLFSKRCQMSDDEFQTPPDFLPYHPLQVLSDKQRAALEGVSLDTIQRRRAKGDAPPRIRLSERRHGTLMRDEAAYLAGKREGSATR